MDTTKRVFTTGEAAKFCQVSQQTIIRVFDAGLLKGFRVPGSKFRRIPRLALIEFMEANGIPTDALTAPGTRVEQIDRELSELAQRVELLNAERKELTVDEVHSPPVLVQTKLVNRVAALVGQDEAA